MISLVLNACESWTAYIDYNGDNDFNDPGEEIFSNTNQCAGGDVVGNGNISPSTYSFTTPANPTENKLLRFRIITDTGFPTFNPCYNPNNGQIEDYGVVFMGTAPPCTPPTVSAPTVTQPTCATPTGTIVVNATGSGTLEYSTDNGTNWQTSNNFSGLAPGSYNIKVRLQSDPSCMAAYPQNPVTLAAPTGC